MSTLWSGPTCGDATCIQLSVISYRCVREIVPPSLESNISGMNLMFVVLVHALAPPLLPHRAPFLAINSRVAQIQLAAYTALSLERQSEVIECLTAITREASI